MAAGEMGNSRGPDGGRGQCEDLGFEGREGPLEVSAQRLDPHARRILQNPFGCCVDTVSRARPEARTLLQ